MPPRLGDELTSADVACIIVPEIGLRDFIGCASATARCNVQTGEVRTRGVEVKGSLAFGLDLIGSYTYQDMKITATNTAAELGKRPVEVPEHIWHLFNNVLAVEMMATWFHPELFEDVDPDAAWMN